MSEPGGGASAHVDTFARDNLPPRELWPEMDFSVLPELAAYADRINAAVELLDKAVSEHGWGGRVAIRYGDDSWTYEALKSLSDRIAKALVEDMGVLPGNRVLLRGANTPGMAAAWLAVLKAGGVCVATMPLLRARELAYMVDKAQISHCLCDIALKDEIDGTRELTPLLERVEYFSADCKGVEGASLDALIAG